MEASGGAQQETGSGGDTVDALGVAFTGYDSISVGGETYSLEDPSRFRYKMNRQKRGIFIIINNKTFEPRTQMGERNGTDEDAGALYLCFKELEFDVSMFVNQTTTQMMKIMIEASKYNHEKSDCFGCAILSHGDNDIVYGTDAIIRIDTLVEPLKGKNCPSLVGKPKIFIIQACRGQELDHGVEASDALAEASEEKKVYRIPAEADILFAYSTVPGYYSWRNSTKGSWFIQALTRVLQRFGKSRDIMWILTRVSNIVALEFESNAAQPYMNKKKQVPQVVSMLTKELYFSPQ